MQLKMIKLAAIEALGKGWYRDYRLIGELAAIYIEKGDRRACCAGNLPVFVQQTGPNAWKLVRGRPRVSAARLAAEQAPWIEHVNALVLDEWEVDSALAQSAVETGEDWSPTAPALDGSGHDETFEAVGGYDPEDEA